MSESNVINFPPRPKHHTGAPDLDALLQEIEVAARHQWGFEPEVIEFPTRRLT
jgi:hypothetical protein